MRLIWSLNFNKNVSIAWNLGHPHLKWMVCLHLWCVQMADKVTWHDVWSREWNPLIGATFASCRAAVRTDTVQFLGQDSWTDSWTNSTPTHSWAFLERFSLSHWLIVRLAVISRAGFKTWTQMVKVRTQLVELLLCDHSWGKSQCFHPCCERVLRWDYEYNGLTINFVWYLCQEIPANEKWVRRGS